jgi:hypothetical protein
MNAARIALFALALASMACANYGAVAEVNRSNLNHLEALKKTVAQDAPFTRVASGGGFGAIAAARSSATQAELEQTFRVRDCRKSDPCKRVLNERLATIDAEFYTHWDADVDRARDLERYQGAMARAISALQRNGEDIQAYLELNWFQRLYTDVRGMDTAALEKIGTDLKAIAGQLKGAE